jgi:monovalent cation:H+ antiporter, CPA1 family
MALAGIEIVLIVFLMVMLASQLLSVRARLPYTVILVFTGVGITALSALTLLGSNTITDSLQTTILQIRSFYTQLVQGGLFVGIVVPPLIFEAMTHIQTPDLRAVIRPSFVLATVGVLISTFVGGLVLWKISGLPLDVSLLFGVIIAPTDAVTVLEVFRHSKVVPRLAAMMDTEAAFNDATAIIIFTIVLSAVTFQRVSVLLAVASFVYSIGGGVAIGLGIAYGARRISSTTDDKTSELILSITAVYGSYILASALDSSGLIAVAVIGLYFGNVTMRSAVSPESREGITTFWEIAAFMGNSVAFLLIGFETTLISFTQSILLIFGAYVAVIIARAASVYPILAIFNQIGERIPISWSNVAMLGGIRGALSIALAGSLTITAILSGSDISMITSMVLGVAFLSIVFQTPLLSRYIERKGMANQ